MKRVFIITDNESLLERFIALVNSKSDALKSEYSFDYGYSPVNSRFRAKYGTSDWIRPVSIKDEWKSLAEGYGIIFSLHCKQMFPAPLVKSVRCINVHPGLNPHNRGWFPQVFSILNGMPCGATIHEMDEHLDHGPVICQNEVKIENWDTSLTAYDKILDAEMDLLRDHLTSILNREYQPFIPGAGNLNQKKDFDNLCKIDLSEQNTFANHINRLRALTHGEYLNAYYVDESGSKVYLKLELFKEQDEKP